MCQSFSHDEISSMGVLFAIVTICFRIKSNTSTSTWSGQKTYLFLVSVRSRRREDRSSNIGSLMWIICLQCSSLIFLRTFPSHGFVILKTFLIDHPHSVTKRSNGTVRYGCSNVAKKYIYINEIFITSTKNITSTKKYNTSTKNISLKRKIYITSTKNISVQRKKYIASRK